MPPPNEQINLNQNKLSHNLKYPIDIKYGSFSTLGLDRIANVMGAYFLFPNKENLIINLKI